MTPIYKKVQNALRFALFYAMFSLRGEQMYESFDFDIRNSIFEWDEKTKMLLITGSMGSIFEPL